MNVRALVLRPRESPGVELIDTDDLQAVIGGDLDEHRSPFWDAAGVVCLTRDGPPAPEGEMGNLFLPTIPCPDCPGHPGPYPVFGTVIWLGTTPARDEWCDLTERQIVILRDILDRLERIEGMSCRPAESALTDDQKAIIVDVIREIIEGGDFRRQAEMN